jgi:predicted nucleic acid-binding protein
VILVDTSVWVEHLRSGLPELEGLLEDGRVHSHPFVVGEIACGNLRQRSAIMEAFDRLPSIEVAGHEEALRLLHGRRLFGSGIGWIDVHLLASALIADAQLWTLDRRLASAARRLRVAASLP